MFLPLSALFGTECLPLGLRRQKTSDLTVPLTRAHWVRGNFLKGNCNAVPHSKQTALTKGKKQQSNKFRHPVSSGKKVIPEPLWGCKWDCTVSRIICQVVSNPFYIVQALQLPCSPKDQFEGGGEGCVVYQMSCVLYPIAGKSGRLN